MKKLILASLTGVIGACGGMAQQSFNVPAQKADASTVGQGDLGTGWWRTHIARFGSGIPRAATW